jgi:hypothetical protein
MPHPNCDPCCEGVECVWCSGTGANAPARWQVSVSGVAEIACDGEGGPTTECHLLNGTFILEQVSSCTWQYRIGSAVCGSHNELIQLTVEAGNLIRVAWSGDTASDPCPCVEFHKAYDAPPSCLEIHEEALAKVLGHWNQCDYSAASVTVTALPG